MKEMLVKTLANRQSNRVKEPAFL